MLTEHDVHLVASVAGNDLDELSVEDAMSTDVYAVDPRTSLDDLASELADRRLGSAVVIDRNRVVGIITTLDLAGALATVLHKHH
jgi:CBS domain-containing protein